MISNIIITDTEHISKKVLDKVTQTWNGADNLIDMIEKCNRLIADIDIYLPADIFFYTNAIAIKYLITNNFKFKYDSDNYKIGHTFSNAELEKLLITDPYSNAKQGGYMFLQMYQDVTLMYNNKLFIANIDINNVQKYINAETVYKHDTYILKHVKTLAKGDFIYRSKLLEYIGNFSIDTLLERNILIAEGKRYYLNNPATYGDRLKEEGIV